MITDPDFGTFTIHIDWRKSMNSYLLYFKSVVKGSAMQMAKFYARASNTVSGHVYIRVPEGLSTGVRMDWPEAAAFHALLGKAIEEAKKPPKQEVRITYTDGTEAVLKVDKAAHKGRRLAKVEVL